jgi:transposase
VELSQKKLQRIKVIENSVEGRITVAEAGEMLGLSERQVKRLKRTYRAGDVEWVHHGKSGRTPANAMSKELRASVVDLATGKYAGFNDTHLHEKLVEKEEMSISRQSVRRILRQAGIVSPQKRRAPKYRSRRERRSQEGAMLLVDASRHDWLEGRGPHLTLLGLVDDATSRVTVAQFQLEAEDRLATCGCFGDR